MEAALRGGDEILTVDNFGEMNAALRAKLKLVAKLLAAASEDEVRTRHQIGQVIVELKRAENKYGANAIERIAKPLWA